MNVFDVYNQEEVIAYMLRTLGIAPHLRGWECLNIAINLCLDDINNLRNMTRRLYPTVATSLGMTKQSVERAMRHAIVEAFDRLPEDALLHQLTDIHIKAIDGRTPCVTLFLAICVELYKREKHHPIFDLRGVADEG